MQNKKIDVAVHDFLDRIDTPINCKLDILTILFCVGDNEIYATHQQIRNVTISQLIQYINDITVLSL